MANLTSSSANSSSSPREREVNEIFNDETFNDDIEEKEMDPKFSTPPGKITFARINQTFCNYPSMDHVGENIAVIKRWIEKAHKDVRFEFGSSSMTSLSPQLSFSGSCDVRDDIFPLEVEVMDDFKEALRGLHACLRNLLETRKGDNEEIKGMADRIVESVARIPSLMKTILLINNEDDRDFVLSMPIIQRVMLCKYSIMDEDSTFKYSKHLTRGSNKNQNNLSHHKCDSSHHTNKLGNTLKALQPPSAKKRINHSSWLLGMLQTKNQWLIDRAIYYLERISDLTVRDYLSISLLDESSSDIKFFIKEIKPSSNDLLEFEAEKRDLYLAISQLRLLVPYLLTLDPSDMDRASTTGVLHFILGRIISKPFSVTVTLFDLIFHFVLVIGWKLVVREDIAYAGGSIFKKGHRVTLASKIFVYGGMLAVCYFIFRLLVESFSMIRVSTRVFCMNILDFWSLVHVTATTMVFIALVGAMGAEVVHMNNTEHGYYIYNGFVILLLWLDFVAFLKIMNPKMATFVFSLRKIMTDMMLFLAIVCISIVAFGDIFYVIIASDDTVCGNGGAWGSRLRHSDDVDKDAENPFCNDHLKSYLEMYRVFVGDVDFGLYEGSWLTLLLYCIATFFLIIVMLNVLIAIVTDSYNQTNENAPKLFGRVQVITAAQHIALEELMLPYPEIMKQSRNRQALFDKFLYKIARFLSFLFIGALISVFVLVLIEASRAGENVAAIAIIGVAGAPFLLSLTVLLSYLYTGWGDLRSGYDWILRIQDNGILSRLIFRPIIFIMLKIMGSSSSGNILDDHKEKFYGQLDRFNQATRAAVSESEGRTRAAFREMSMRMEEMEVRRVRDMNSLQQQLEHLTRALSTNKGDADRE